MIPKSPLPADIEIQIEVRFISGEQLLQQGILSIGENEVVKDFRLAGIAAQRGVYEMLLSLWNNHEKSHLNNFDH